MREGQLSVALLYFIHERRCFNLRSLKKNGSYIALIVVFIITMIIMMGSVLAAQSDNVYPVKPEVQEDVRAVKNTDIPELIEVPLEETIISEEVIVPVEEVIPEPEIAKVEDVTYVIKQGDCFWGIANKFYGNGNYYESIAQANNMNSQDEIYAGQEIIIPNTPELVIPEEVIAPKEVVTETKTYNSSYTGGTLDDIFNAPSISDYSNLTLFAKCTITAYDPMCSHCCGKKYPDAVTASGKVAEIGRTAGMTGLPLGTKIYIEGIGYFTVEDTGNVKSTHVDIAANSHADCYEITRKANVYIVN